MENNVDNVNIEEFNYLHQDEIVRQVVLVGSTQGFYRLGTRSPLHWRIFLLLRNGSVILNMKNDEGSIGTLYIISKDYQMTQNRHGVFIANVRDQVTVGQFIDIVIEMGRARYMYNANGRGCRWWCETVLEDIAALGLIESSCPRNFRNYIERSHQVLPLLFPLPTTEGRFL